MKYCGLGVRLLSAPRKGAQLNSIDRASVVELVDAYEDLLKAMEPDEEAHSAGMWARIEKLERRVTALLEKLGLTHGSTQDDAQ